jgi:hypothetical protein
MTRRSVSPRGCARTHAIFAALGLPTRRFWCVRVLTLLVRSPELARGTNTGHRAMGSQLRFAMHPEDELSFLDEVLKEPSVVLIDGPRWKAAEPRTTRSLASIGTYCIIWSPEDLACLKARFIPTCNDWYCESEHSTIQFLRSSLTETVLTEGRIAVATESASSSARLGVERRFKFLRKFLKKNYVNSAIRWQNPKLPLAPRGPSRSANPGEPDSSLWVGPAALSWLRDGEERRIKQTISSNVEGFLAPPPDKPSKRGRR